MKQFLSSIGQFVTPTKKATKLVLTATSKGIPNNLEMVNPRLAPMAKVGTISPPLSPAAIANDVSIIFIKKATLFNSLFIARSTRFIPAPLYMSVPSMAQAAKNTMEEIKALIYELLIYFV